MSNYAIFKDLVPISIPLGDIYLDPNNPRFVGANWQYVPDAQIDQAPIQQSARLRLVSGYGVDKLRINMEVNGYLPIDRVVVRAFGEGKYVVLEGNRRICAAKMIGSHAADGSAVSLEVLSSLKEIPCLQYIGTEEDAAWVFQGIRHITGVAEWSAYNKARLLVEQMEEEKLNLTAVGTRFGLTAYGAGQWVRGYYAFQQARSESDYVRELDEKAYPYFQELFSRSSAAVRDWLEWGEKSGEGTYKFKNIQNLNEFVGWLYPRQTADSGEESSDSRGDWEKRLLKTRDDLRYLSFLIVSAPKYFEQFRKDHDLERAYAVANAEAYQEQAAEKADSAQAVLDTLTACIKSLDGLPLKMFRNEEMKSVLMAKLELLLSQIEELKATSVNAAGR